VEGIRQLRLSASWTCLDFPARQGRPATGRTTASCSTRWSGVRDVIDHLGRVDLPEDENRAASGALLRLLDSGKVWVKTSGVDRVSREGPPFRDAVALAADLVARAPERVVWGTDFPHPNIVGDAPDDGQLVDLLTDIAPGEEVLRQVLVLNPIDDLPPSVGRPWPVRHQGRRRGRGGPWAPDRERVRRAGRPGRRHRRQRRRAKDVVAGLPPVATGHHLAIAADLTSPGMCGDAVAAAVKGLGGMDAAVHAVGINNRRPVLEVDDWDEILSVMSPPPGHCRSRSGRWRHGTRRRLPPVTTARLPVSCRSMSARSVIQADQEARSSSLRADGEAVTPRSQSL
jgi:hypothetical protein